MVTPRWRYPHQHEAGDRLDELPARVEDGLFIECDVVSPRSMLGRRVTLHVPNDQADAMLLTLRAHAIARRRTPASEAGA